MSNEDRKIARRVRIDGRVQGVWFRGWTVDEARERGLRGWVRNRSDGSVEALLIGPEGAVEGMISALYEGPPSARVSNVHAEAVEDDGSDAFSQEKTV